MGGLFIVDFSSILSSLPFLVSLLKSCRLLPLSPVIDVSSWGGVHSFITGLVQVVDN